jgi:hypothetical protein
VQQVRTDSRNLEWQYELLETMMRRRQDRRRAQVTASRKAAALPDAPEQRKAVRRGDLGQPARQVEGVMGNAAGSVVRQARVNRDVHQR